jgi:hypothetical protein
MRLRKRIFSCLLDPFKAYARANTEFTLADHLVDFAAAGPLNFVSDAKYNIAITNPCMIYSNH